VSGDVMMCHWGVTEKPMIREKGFKPALTIYHDFMQRLFNQNLRGKAI